MKELKNWHIVRCRIGLVLLLSLGMFSCSTKRAEYIHVIPADASGVVAIDLKSLIDKTGIKDKENREFVQKLTDALKSGMNAATYQQVEAILKDPARSGIDIEAPFYLFEAPSFPYPTMVAKVVSEDNLRKLLETMKREQLCTEVEEADGYSYVMTDRQVLIAFTPAALMVVSGQTEKVKEALPSLLRQPLEKSIAATPAFGKMRKQGGDIDMIIPLSSLSEPLTHPMLDEVSKRIDLKEMKLIGNLSFGKGKIEWQLEGYTENAGLRTLMEKQMKCTSPIENTFLKYLPQSTLAVLSIGLNGNEFYNVLQENEEFRDEFSITRAAEVKELFGAFRGDLTVGLVNVTMKNDPAFVAYADMKNDTPLTTLYGKQDGLGLKRGEEIVKLGENDYIYKSRKGHIFFGIRDKQMYATNDELIYKNICKVADPSLKTTDLASYLKGRRVAVAVNAEAILDLPIVKLLMGFGGKEAAVCYSLLGNISYVGAVGNDDKATVTLQLKNREANALKQIVGLAKQIESSPFK